MDEYLKYIFHEDLYIIEQPTEATHEAGDGNKPASGVQEPPPLKFLGSNDKKILILVNDHSSEFLNSNDLDFLMRIIEGGLKYSRSDIAVVNCVKFAYEQIFDEVNYEYIIAFGDHASEYVGEGKKYEAFKNRGKKVLLAENLREIEGDKGKKTSLWKALQIMFDIN
jgi:hypothetical protein